MTSTYYAEGHTDYRLQELLGYDSRIVNIVATVNARVKPGSRLLDLGCGDMAFRALLPQMQYVGVDLDTAKAPDAVKHDLSVTPYPFKDAEFDAVICSEVLEHLWNPETALAELKRIMKPGGTLVITVPNFGSIDNRLTDFESLLYHKDNLFSIEHIRQYTVRSLAALLQTHGFTTRNVLGNSAYMSGFFTKAREALGKFLKTNGVTSTHAGVDQVLGIMFPDLCPGFLIEATRSP